MKTPPKRKPAKQVRSMDKAVQRYEALKAGFRQAGLPPAEYARACLRAARKAGL